MDRKARLVSAVAARRYQQKFPEPSIVFPEPQSNEEPLLKKAKLSPKQPSRETSASNECHKNAAPIELKSDVPRSISSIGSIGERYYSAEAAGEYPSRITKEESHFSSGENSYDPASTTSARYQNFLLSKSCSTKNHVVYSTGSVLCVRLKLKTTLVLLGQYDLWVKRGVISIMGAKLHPGPQLYRVYAPSTHSLPVIKCVSGIEDYAEVEIRSCRNGIFLLRHISNLFHRIWNSGKGISGGIFRGGEQASFSVLYSSSDDPLRRYLRPLHLEKKWVVCIKALSQCGSSLRVMTCGPKGSGKSTFNNYLLNHLLTRLSSRDVAHPGQDGVAFLDLDPGQPEFSPMGHVYLAHLRSPVFGPSFSHPMPDDGSIIRSHYIGYTSLKDDPDHYLMAAMDLVDHYHILRQSHPQLPLIINYPGWIFGLGLEIAILLVKSLSLSDVLYMSEKGPAEVVEPLERAASDVGISVTILPSQPTEFVTRSSSQLRSMHTLSYFHSTQHQGKGRIWSDLPLSRSRPMVVNYSGTSQGILGIMILGSHQDPELLYDFLDGAVVGVVAIENLDAIACATQPPIPGVDEIEPINDGERSEACVQYCDLDGNLPIDGSTGSGRRLIPARSLPPSPPPSQTQQPRIIRTARENLPFLSIGNGGYATPNPKSSRSLGLAIVRAINTERQTLELITPIATSAIRAALEDGNRIVLVRGQLDSPSWAISEEYFTARTAQRRHRKLTTAAKLDDSKPDAMARQQRDGETQKLRERIRRAGNVPWMRLIEDGGGMNVRREKNMWKLRKKAYPTDSGSGSDGDW